MALLAATCAVGDAAAAQLLKRFEDWSAYLHEDAGQRLCFLVSEPKSREPKAAKRDPPYLYVSAWPSAAQRAEISIKMGYPVKAGSEATVSVEAESFRLFAEADRVFVADPAEEARLVKAMRKGTRLTVAATSERGTATSDSYSLAGLAQALDVLAGGCQ